MNIDLIKKYVPNITDDEISHNVDIDVVSAYGGMTCMVIPVGDIVEFVESQERQLGMDYYLYVSE